MDKEFVIFRAGTYKNKGKFDQAYLDRAVKLYDPKNGHEAPLVLGDHPKVDTADPAFGWVESIRRVGRNLVAKFRDVAPELIGNRKFKKPSAAFDEDGCLHHVALLGARVPAVKGLEVAFDAEAASKRVITFSEDDIPEEDRKRTPAAPGGGIEGESGHPEDDDDDRPTEGGGPRTFEGDQMDPKQIKAMVEEAVNGAKAEFAEQVTKLTEENQGLRKDLDAERSTRRRERLVTFAEDAVKRGNLTKANIDTPGLVEFTESLLDREFTFTGKDKDGNEVEVKQNSYQFFSDFVAQLRPQVPMGRTVIHGQTRRGKTVRTEAATDGKGGLGETRIAVTDDTPREAVEFAERAEARAAEKDISIEEAARELVTEDPSLVAPPQ